MLGTAPFTGELLFGRIEKNVSAKPRANFCVGCVDLLEAASEHPPHKQGRRFTEPWVKEKKIFGILLPDSEAR